MLAVITSEWYPESLLRKIVACRYDDVYSPVALVMNESVKSIEGTRFKG